MLALKNKIIYENILTNVSFKYGIGAIFWITKDIFEIDEYKELQE